MPLLALGPGATIPAMSTPLSKLEHALDAAVHGLPVFPQQGKVPAIRAWPTNASAKPSVIERWWTRWPEHDIGIALPPDIYVLDADSSVALMDYDRLGLPRTLRVQTARGFHAYFRVPAQLARVSPGGPLGALEGKGAPGPVTWAGSVHPTGVVYRLVVDAPIATMPGELVRRIGPKRAGRRQGEATPEEQGRWAHAASNLRYTVQRHDPGTDILTDLVRDAQADLHMAQRALDCELPEMEHGWADRFYRAAAYLGRHIPSGALTLDEVTGELVAMFQKHDTRGDDPSHVFRSIRRGAAAGARDAEPR